MPLCVFYTNCQGDGLIHFMKKTAMGKAWDFQIWHNWQIIMGEQSVEGLNESAAKADVFIYQHTPSLKYGSLSSEEMVAKVIPKHCKAISIGYCWNTGFFPIVHHGQWWTGQDVIARANRGEDIKTRFETDWTSMRYDCARRFAENLAEQARRELACDVRMAPWILDNYRNKHMFLLCNHPASELLVAWAGVILGCINVDWLWEKMPIVSANEANLPGFHWLHPAVIEELGLNYTVDEGDRAYFPFLIEKLMQKPFET